MEQQIRKRNKIIRAIFLMLVIALIIAVIFWPKLKIKRLNSPFKTEDTVDFETKQPDFKVYNVELNNEEEIVTALPKQPIAIQLNKDMDVNSAVVETEPKVEIKVTITEKNNRVVIQPKNEWGFGIEYKIIINGKEAYKFKLKEFTTDQVVRENWTMKPTTRIPQNMEGIPWTPPTKN
jgi:hypothetical protein